MKAGKITGVIRTPQTKKQCRLYQDIQGFAQQLNRLADAADAVKDRKRSAPLHLLPMVF